MTQLQAGSFRGSDVDGLDRVVNKMTDAAEFADDVVTALKALATALDCMSWTGWAAAFARYLRAVVIPWVKTVAQYLRGFAKVLALISQTQKDTSSDHPTVHIPASAFQPVVLPATSTANAPQLAAPESGVAPSAQGGGAAGAGAQVVVPVSIGSVTVHVHGAAGGGADTTAPTTPVARPDTGGGATGDGTVAAGPVTAGPTAALGSAGALGGGGEVTSPVGGGSGGGTGGGSGGGPVAPAAPAIGTPAPTPAPSPVDAGAIPGDPPVSTIPVGLGAALGDGPGAIAVPALEERSGGGGAPVALAAAPLGLAALGASALGALRKRDQDETDETGTPVATDVTIDGRSAL